MRVWGKGTVAALTFVGACAVLPAGTAGAQTFTLPFSGLGGNGAAIPASYGDVAGVVDVGIRRRATWGNATVLDVGGFHWTEGYNDLVNVAYTGSGLGVGEIVLDNLAAGQSITFDAADVGAWPNTSAVVGLRVYDFAYNLLFQGTGNTVGSTTHATFDPAGLVAGVDGLYVQWSRVDAAGNPVDSFNTGIDNVRFTVGPTEVVPEPGTAALVAGGLLLAGAAARRRRAA